ncbi:MAG: YihA family ribosome biogenesis GTP-binding protein, partial [Bacteroidales bacterium]|nr:YihA family ribosome biogenesis GTP-binding protein [Bacteroidales bacterium]
MNISKAKFLVSSAKVAQCPDSKQPEFAFIGRSNVGKSSLINMLCNQKGLAKVSATPGKTQLINHFDINNGEWYLVDLPGYGYAKVPLGEKAKFQSIITDYALKREQLTSFFVLVDVRHPIQTIDRNFMEFLGLHGVPFAIIFTKADKLSESQVQRSV